MDIQTADYGSGEAGLVCGFWFRPGLPVKEVTAADAQALLAEAPQGRMEGFLWLHFHLPHNRCEPWMRAHAQLPDAFYEALAEGTRSTRIDRDEDQLIAVMNDLSFDFAYEPTDIATLWVNVREHLVLTARRQSLRSVDKLRAAVKRGAPIRSSVQLLEHLLRDQADVMVEILRSVTIKVDGIEDQLLSGRLRQKRADLGAMRRLLVRLQRLLAPEPAALFRLLQRPPSWIEIEDVQDLHQSSEEFSVVLRDMAALNERIKLLQEEMAAQVNEQNNRSLFVLTVVTVLALPINMIAGLMGMNVGGIPLAEDKHGFWVIVSIVASFTVIAGRWAFKDKGDE